MKPRLRVTPLTEEDFAIWDWLSEPRTGAPFEDGVPLWDYQEAHLRDADLMLVAQQLPWAWHCQVGEGDWHLVRSKDMAKSRDPLWGSQWSQS